MPPKKSKKKKKKVIGSKIADQIRNKQKASSFDLQAALDTAGKFQQTGNLKQAELVYRQIVSVAPGNFIAFYNLGIIAHQTGRVKEGIQLLNKSISLNPKFPNGHNSLGILLEQQGDFKTAATLYNKAISLNTDFVEAYYNLGNLYIKEGKLELAVKNLNKALSFSPNFVEARINLANALHMQGDFEAAISCYNKALSQSPDLALVHNNLGNVFKDIGDIEAAIQSYQKAISLKPDYSEAHHNIGYSMTVKGLFTSAAESFRKAIDVSPDFTEAHRSLSAITKYSPGDTHITEMETLLSDTGLAVNQQVDLAFGLAKAHEDLRDYNNSFRYLLKGNSLKRATYNYTINESKALFDKIKRAFDTINSSPKSPSETPDKVPVFILGMPRSGTSLVEQILASHSDIFGAGELEDFKQIILKLTRSFNLEGSIDHLSEHGWKDIGRIGSEYIERLKKFSVAEQYITDKMPYNFLLIGFIRFALPNAKIIHCKRNPMDTCFSIYKNFFTGEHKYAYDLTELGEYYLLYQDLMQYWEDKYPDDIYTIHYEQLVANIAEESQRLLDHCGLPWQQQCLSFHKTPRVVATASMRQVREPVYQSSVKLWKHYEKDLQPLYQILQEVS